jgi:hypothetical protein
VAHVLEFTARHSARSRWLIWCHRLADADARLLIHAEHRAVRRWVEQELDDGDGLGGEVGIAHLAVRDDLALLRQLGVVL